jgi:hypothetical protein
VGLPLLGCAGCVLLFNDAVHQVRDNEQARPQVARDLIKREGYVNVALLETPESHPLGYMVDAHGSDDAGKEHRLFLVFRNNGSKGELIYLSEEGHPKRRTAEWDKWLPIGKANAERAKRKLQERLQQDPNFIHRWKPTPSS